MISAGADLYLLLFFKNSICCKGQKELLTPASVYIKDIGFMHEGINK